LENTSLPHSCSAWGAGIISLYVFIVNMERGTRRREDMKEKKKRKVKGHLKLKR
jgi:hypothetical protein